MRFNGSDGIRIRGAECNRLHGFGKSQTRHPRLLEKFRNQRHLVFHPALHDRVVPRNNSMIHARWFLRFFT